VPLFHNRGHASFLREVVNPVSALETGFLKSRTRFPRQKPGYHISLDCDHYTGADLSRQDSETGDVDASRPADERRSANRTGRIEKSVG
jgi:hypothetical protein